MLAWTAPVKYYPTHVPKQHLQGTAPVEYYPTQVPNLSLQGQDLMSITPQSYPCGTCKGQHPMCYLYLSIQPVLARTAPNVCYHTFQLDLHCYPILEPNMYLLLQNPICVFPTLEPDLSVQGQHLLSQGCVMSKTSTDPGASTALPIPVKTMNPSESNSTNITCFQFISSSGSKQLSHLKSLLFPCVPLQVLLLFLLHLLNYKVFLMLNC